MSFSSLDSGWKSGWTVIPWGAALPSRGCHNRKQVMLQWVSLEVCGKTWCDTQLYLCPRVRQSRTVAVDMPLPLIYCFHPLTEEKLQLYFILYQWMQRMPFKTKQNTGSQSVLCLRNQILDNNLISGQQIRLAPTQIHSFLKWPMNFRWGYTDRTLRCWMTLFSPPLFFLPLSWGKFGFLPVFMCVLFL